MDLEETGVNGFEAEMFRAMFIKWCVSYSPDPPLRSQDWRGGRFSYLPAGLRGCF